jgi:hypothetical protein
VHLCGSLPPVENGRCPNFWLILMNSASEMHHEEVIFVGYFNIGTTYAADLFWIGRHHSSILFPNARSRNWDLLYIN